MSSPDPTRNRQCGLGWHDECSDPLGEVCECECHPWTLRFDVDDLFARIMERRQDEAFMQRLADSMERNRHILDALKEAGD